MDIRQLEYFRKIAETGSISEAARQLHLSQPPLSYQLRGLEEELGVPLFQRSRQGVTLTEAGKLLYQRAGELLRFADSAKLEVSQIGQRQVLRLGMTSTTVAPMMPILSEFSRRNPRVHFEVHDGPSFSLYTLLLNGIIDLSVVRTPLRLDEVEHLVLRKEPMIAVSAAPFPDGSLRLSDLADCPLILYRRYEAFLLDAFHAQGLEPEVFCLCDDARSAMQWAEAGLATAIFPQSMQSLCGSLHLCPIDEPTLQTEILLIWRKNEPLRPLAQSFLRLAETPNCVDSMNSGQ